MQQPVGAESDRLDLGRPGERREHHVDALRQLARAVHPRRSRLDMGRRRLLPEIVDGHLVSGRLEIRRHAAAHEPQPDEPDLHDGVPPDGRPLTARGSMLHRSSG